MSKVIDKYVKALNTLKKLKSATVIAERDAKEKGQDSEILACYIEDREAFTMAIKAIEYRLKEPMLWDRDEVEYYYPAIIEEIRKEERENTLKAVINTIKEV